MSIKNPSAEALAKLIGWTITAVKPFRKGEAIARLTLTSKGQIRRVTVCRGQEIYLESDQIYRGDEGLYQDLTDMLVQIQAFVLSDDSDKTIEPLDNVLTRRIGFQCLDKTWEIDLTRVLASPSFLRELASTPEGRQQMATTLSSGWLPTDSGEGEI